MGLWACRANPEAALHAAGHNGGPSEADMTPSPESRRADARHWRGARRIAVGLTALWLLIGFGPAFFARDLQFTLFGVPFGVWMAAQGAPILFVVLVWAYERRLDRLDREHREQRGHGDAPGRDGR